MDETAITYLLKVQKSDTTWLDITPYIKAGGFKWTRNDIEDPDAGRTLDGIMHRGRVSTKIKLEVTLMSLESYKLAPILQAIYPEFVQVKYLDPQEGTYVEKTMYSNNNPASFATVHSDGKAFWSEITFPLVEK